jgi:low affinity Fe/Cu permease
MNETMSPVMSDGQPDGSKAKTGTRIDFQKVADRAAKLTGSKWAFIFAVSLVVVWAAFGPYFRWSDTHQLFINTTTTIITFLVVFLLQNSQNRGDGALHVKLDEILRSIPQARNELIGLQQKTEEEIKEAEVEIVTEVRRND